MAVLPGGPGRSRTRTSPVKSRQLFLLSYGARCGRQASNLRAPRFRRALYRAELRPRKWAELESNPATPRVTPEKPSTARATRPSSGTRTRTPISTFRAWRLPLDDPGMSLTYVSPGSCRTMLSMPLAYPSTLDRRSRRARRPERRPTWRSFGARILAIGGKCARKSRRLLASAISCAERRGVFLSQTGPRFDLGLPQAGHHLTLDFDWSPSEQKRRPGWVALVWLAMRLGS
jgi:hypothetical protein